MTNHQKTKIYKHCLNKLPFLWNISSQSCAQKIQNGLLIKLSCLAQTIYLDFHLKKQNSWTSEILRGPALENVLRFRHSDSRDTPQLIAMSKNIEEIDPMIYCLLWIVQNVISWLLKSSIAHQRFIKSLIWTALYWWSINQCNRNEILPNILL